MWRRIALLNTRQRLALSGIAALWAVMIWVIAVGAGSMDVSKVKLYGGSNTDSTEQASPWFPVRGANRVLLRFWTAKAAFHASTDADSTFSDSVTVLRVAFTDSLTSVNPIIAGDSVIYTASFVDTSVVMAGCHNPPLNQSLRGPDNGSGIYSSVIALTPGAVTADGNGVFPKQYMRVYLTPLRRNTVTGGNSTAGKRVNGLKGLRGEALVVRPNR